MSGHRVCDSCHSRKVRCDRNNPCGNCLDRNVGCTRIRGMRRLRQRDVAGVHSRTHGERLPTIGPLAIQRPLEQSPSSSLSGSNVFPQQMNDEGFLVNMIEAQRSMLLGHLDINMGYELHSWMSFVPLTEDQMINRQLFSNSQHPTRSRRQALESALSFAGRILGSVEQCTESKVEEAQSHIPSLELLYWMLNDIGSDKFGSFISDYFRHVGKEDLRHMGLSILFNTVTPSNSNLYTVCVNSMAFRFLNTTLGTGRDDDASAQRLRHNALLYRETAKAALKKVSLVTKPSLPLLQALLCGIFLHQGSGDTSTCRDLTKTACRVCMDIGLHPDATNLQEVTEAEYYCFMWCYKLDRNYACKFGGPRILTMEPETIISPSAAPNITASEFILIYLDIAKVQDGMIPFLNDPTKAAKDDAFQPIQGVGTLLLQKMESIRHDIDQIKTPSPKWTGLNPVSEIPILDFAYHCILTNLLHLRQISLGQVAAPADPYLASARRGLQALITLCASSDRQKKVAYLHRSLLYYPITACIAIFCNTLATSHSGDFATLTTVSHSLAQTEPLSPGIAAMQTLLRTFVSLSECFILDLGSDRSNPDAFISGHGHGHEMVPVSLPFSLESTAIASLGAQDELALSAFLGLGVSVGSEQVQQTFENAGSFEGACYF